MGSHRDALSIAGEIHTTVFGTPATYTPPGGATIAPGVFNYLRPDGVSLYRRPDGVSLYKRPGVSPDGGASVESITVIPYPVRIEPRESTAGMIEVRVREVMVDATQIASPQRLATITIDNRDWTIEQIERAHASRWKFSLALVDSLEINRHQYRRGAR